jgi:hypothetical protein
MRPRTTDDGGHAAPYISSIMSEGSASGFVCAACGGAIGAYERCLVVVGGGPVEILSWLSLAEDERKAARAEGTYHHGCYSQGAAHVRHRQRTRP